MNYKVGDKVVCIDSMPPDGHCLVPGIKCIVLGAQYSVVGITGRCTQLAEFPHSGTRCSYCGTTHGSGYSHWESWRFIKLDGLTVTTEEEATA